MEKFLHSPGLSCDLEIMGNKEVTKISFPSSHVLNKELCALMAAAAPTNTVGPEEWEETIAADDCPPTANTIAIKWPAAGKEASPGKPKFLCPTLK